MVNYFMIFKGLGPYGIYEFHFVGWFNLYILHLVSLFKVLFKIKKKAYQWILQKLIKNYAWTSWSGSDIFLKSKNSHAFWPPGSSESNKTNGQGLFMPQKNSFKITQSRNRRIRGDVCCWFLHDRFNPAHKFRCEGENWRGHGH